MSAYDDDYLYLAEMWGEKLASSDKQHIIALYEGPTGYGKSYAAIDTAWKTSIHLAYKRGGDPEDYFTIDNVAIITPDEVLRVAKEMKLHGEYILDDIGVGLSSRKWNQKSNEVINNILMTFRTLNNLLLMTVPNKSMVDKNARRLTHNKIVMTSQLFKHGLTFGKLSKVKYQYHKDSDKAIYPFYEQGGKYYNLVAFEMPPKHMVKEYDKRRKEIEEQNRTETLDELEELQNGNAPKPKYSPEMVEFADRFNHYVEMGYKKKEAFAITKKEFAADEKPTFSDRHLRTYNKDMNLENNSMAHA
jgi:hypothetical protein